MDITDVSAGIVRFRFGGVSWAERTSCVDGGKCSDKDMALKCSGLWRCGNIAL